MTLLAVVTGYVFAAPEHTSDAVLVWTTGTACLGLALAVAIAHVKVHPWWPLAPVWVGFVAGMAPPLSDDDALWAVAVVMFAGLALGYLVLVNAIVVAVVEARQQRRTAGAARE
ncbi:hypothetical protein [Kineococcus terrestris]|uniref:hypothetical protein n=1 Tax=Kineococcus terrestris TaxID=2044856 RepID=UPI0034DADA81